MSRVFWVAIALLLIAGVYFGITHFKPVTLVKSAQPTAVAVSSVSEQSVPIDIRTTGNLAAYEKTSISPKVGGYITSLTFTEGQYVKAGTVLMHLDDSKQKQQLLSSEAQASLAKSTYQRYLVLSKQKITSPQEIDKYRSDYKKAVATVKGDKSSLRDTVLKAPISGFLGAKTVSTGNYVNPGQNLLEITNTKTLRINYSVPSRYSPQLKLGQKVEVTASFLPNKTFIAKVSYIAPEVDPTTQTIAVHATLTNQNQLLKPGQSVNISQKLGVLKNALLIPADALITSINGNYVYVVKKGKIATVSVEVGEHHKNSIIVLKGLTAKQKLVTKGQFQVKNGARVRVVS